MWCAAGAESPSGGRFLASYLPPESSQYQPIFEVMREERILEEVAAALNEVFVMPREVQLVMAEVGQPNAFYAPEHHAVVLSYELVAHFVELFADQGEDTGRYASGALLFVLFHELGHCLIGELGLPAVGREEDAVDEFATLLLLQMGEEGQMAILSAAAWFAEEGATSDAHLPFWDEHALSMQRFFGVFTLLYATDPERYREAALSLGISERRLQLAEEEYRKKDEAWSHLLAPHVR